MDQALSDKLDRWTDATAKLSWGIQRVFSDVFKVAADEGTTLIYGSDYRDGNPCLVNTVGSMLKVGGGEGVPSANFGEIVGLFDDINRHLETINVNTKPGYVSPLAADIFLQHFATLKDAPTIGEIAEKAANAPYSEPTDEAMIEAMVNIFTSNEPCDIAVDENDVANVVVDDVPYR